MMKNKKASQEKFSIRSEWLAVLLLVLVLLLVNFEDLTVRISEINYWDEARYIIRGRELTQGVLPEFAWSPLTSSFFALLYLPFRDQGNWLPAVASIGRVIIYLFSCLSLYLIGREVKAIPQPVTVFGMALIYPAMVSMLKFQSDAWFAVLSGFALWQVLRYKNSLRAHSLWNASLFCGLASLTRNDGLILFVVFLLVVFLVIKNREVSLKGKLTASLIPFTGLVIGYLMLYAAVTGEFFPGTSERTWAAFEQGHYFIFPDDEMCQTSQLSCAVERVSELFGSAEENNFSVLRAIINNPQAFADRLGRMLKRLPGMAYRAYGGRTAFSLVIFGVFGAARLLRLREKSLLLIFAGWMFYLPVYLLTFYRPGYFYLPFTIFYLLAVLGVYELLEQFIRDRPRILISALLSGLAALGLLLSLEPVYHTAGLLLAALWVGWGIRKSRTNRAHPLLDKTPTLLLIVVGVVLHGAFDFPDFGRAPPLAEEEAIILLFTEFPQNSLVAAGAPGAVASAQMQYVHVSMFDTSSPEILHQELIAAGVEAIYVDHHLSEVNQHYWKLIEPGVGEMYQRVFSGNQGSIQVLAVLP